MEPPWNHQQNRHKSAMKTQDEVQLLQRHQPYLGLMNQVSTETCKASEGDAASD